jgi:DedD protein
MAEAQQDVDTLKRRGRRRLVGAVALVLLAVIVLPMIFDPAPRNAPQVSVRIPGEDEGTFKPKPQVKPSAPVPALPAVEEKKAEESKAAEKKPEEKKAQAARPPEPKAAQKKAEPTPDSERARAEAALANAEFVVPVGAFLNPDPVIAKLAAAKIRYYTEKVSTAQGTVTRVRAGPFVSKAEAEKALQALKKLGLSPGNVSAKS